MIVSLCRYITIEMPIAQTVMNTKHIELSDQFHQFCLNKSEGLVIDCKDRTDANKKIQVCLGVWVLSEVGTDAWEGRDEERWDRSGVWPIWREIHLCILRKYRNTNVQV